VRQKTLVAVVATLGLLLAVVVVHAGSSAESAAAPRPIKKSCPRVGPGNASLVTVDQVIATARRVVVDHHTEEIQGHRYRLNEKTTPVLEAVMLGDSPPLPGRRSLARLAKSRCPKTDPTYTWAVVFGDTISVVCCLRTTVFVAATKRAWFVF
jgi:hypothetical protein